VYFDDVYLELSNALNLSNPTTQNEPIPGDADWSGCVNMIDFAFLFAAWLLGPEPPAPWEAGNFDYDDAVDMTDVSIMAEHWLDGCTTSDE
jgi:hypothetical protein